MRKALILTVAMLLALAGFAAADATLDGLGVKSEIFVEGVSADLGTVAAGDFDAEFLNARGRFFLNYTKADWKGVLGLEMGEFASLGGAYFGTTTARDKTIVEVKHLYVQGPLGPVTATIGLQPLALGYGTILDEDFVAVNLAGKAGPGTAGFAYIKRAETFNAEEDVTCFALYYAGTFGGFSLKPYGIYGLTDADGVEDFYFVGLPFGGKFGPVDVKAEVDYLGGDLGGATDISDFAAYVKAVFGLGAANVYLEGGYGGEDMKQINENLTFDIVYEDAYFRRSNTGLQNFMFGKLGANYTMGALMLDAAVIQEQKVEPSDSIGTELDIKASYKASDSVTIDAGYGYMMAGDVLTDDQYKAYWKATFRY